MKPTSTKAKEVIELGRVGQAPDDELIISRLLFCASRGDLTTLESLYAQHHPDLNLTDYDGRTCLHVASGLGHMKVVEFLIAHGANVNARDRFGGTPRDDAVRHGQEAITTYLLEKGATHPAEAFELELIYACSKGNVDQVTRLLRNKINPNCCDYDGRSPLHLAVAIKSSTLVNMLLEFGADPLVKDRFGGTPLSDAIRGKARVGRDTILEILKKAAAARSDAENLKKDYFVRFISTDAFKLLNPFVLIVLIFEMLMIVFYALFGSYSYEGEETELTADVNRYPYFQDVHVMIFVGFGFLMTFLRKVCAYTFIKLTSS